MANTFNNFSQGPSNNCIVITVKLWCWAMLNVSTVRKKRIEHIHNDCKTASMIFRIFCESKNIWLWLEIFGLSVYVEHLPVWETIVSCSSRQRSTLHAPSFQLSLVSSFIYSTAGTSAIGDSWRKVCSCTHAPLFCKELICWQHSLAAINSAVGKVLCVKWKLDNG